MAELNPDEVLKKALGLAQSMTEARTPFEGDGARLAELVLALDRWLIAGGRTPARWVENSVAAAANGTTRSSDEG